MDSINRCWDLEEEKMGETDTDMMIHRHHSSLGSCSIPKQQQQQQEVEINPNNLIRSSAAAQFSSESGNSNSKRVGVPPTSPYSQIHSRSMSQPSSFFSFDSLPPLSPSPFNNNNNNPSSSLLPPSPFTRCNSDSSRVVLLPPRKSHRRSNSDISGGESADWSTKTTPPFVKKESGEREDMDDLFSAYMNLENIDDMESSRASGTKTNGSDDTEGESSSVNYESGGDRNNSLKRRAGAGGGDIAPTSRHYRSVSVDDSCFMEKMSFGEDSLKPPPTNSVNGGIEFKSGEFNAAEMKKIMANDKLAEMAVSDPKRVKRYIHCL